MRIHLRRRSALGFAVIAALVALPPAARATHQALRRGIGSYFILGMREVGLKNLDFGSNVVCGSPTDAFLNVGVNCEDDALAHHCGVVRMEQAHIFSPGESSQVVADSVLVPKPGGTTFGMTTTLDQVFRNDVDPLSPIVIVNDPPEQTFAPPILPGTCDAFCNPDYDAVKTLCNFPVPFPACNKNNGVVVRPGQDCAPYDTNLGNGFCDLPPGVYGFSKITNDAVLQLQAGNYTFCTLRAGTSSRINGNGAEIRIVGGRFRGGNLSVIGQGCGDLTIKSDSAKAIAFGRNSSIAANVCAPRARIRLGHDNDLTGQFIGDRISSDRNNVGHVCCN